MFYEFKHPGLFEYFCKETGTNFNYPLHLHQSFEVIVVLQGSMKVTVEQKNYEIREKEGVLVFPYQSHSLESQNCDHLLLIFSADLVKSFSRTVSDQVPKNNRFSLTDSMITSLQGLENNSSKYQKKGVLYLLCHLFEQHAQYTHREKDKKNLLLPIFLFVEQNYKTECSLETLAKELKYDYSYLSRYIKRRIDISYNSYVNQYRISKACTLLNETDNKILQCALECGYESLRSFNRNFSIVMGISPKEYRKQRKG